MAFVPKEWKDRLVEFAGRRKLTNVSTGEEMIVDVARNEGAVSQEGDAFSAANMSDLEQRVAEEFNNINTNLQDFSTDLNISSANYIGAVANGGKITISNYKTILVVPCMTTIIMRSPSIVHLNLFNLTGISMMDIGIQNSDSRNNSFGIRITKSNNIYTFKCIEDISSDVDSIKIYGIK